MWDKRYLRPSECKRSPQWRAREMPRRAPHRSYFKHSYQEVANKTSAVKFYRPVKCNLIKALKCLLYWLLVQQHSDSTVMEDAINGIINEAVQWLCNQIVPFNSWTYLKKQWGVENSGDSTGTAGSTFLPSFSRLITVQFLSVRSFTSAALATTSESDGSWKVSFYHRTKYRLFKSQDRSIYSVLSCLSWHAV